MEEIIIRKMGAIGRMTLNRPQALNSLTANMVKKIDLALDEWESDKDVTAVVIDAAGEKAFCAGGDITDIYNEAQKRNFEYGKKFWANEYRLNLKISNYPKPYIAFMQGYTMGGGVGISCHGSCRVVEENSIIAMPECSIGLVPDVGGSHLLARLDNNLGQFLGTTAARMTASDAIFCRFADHFIPRGHWEEVIRLISKNGDVYDTINKYQRSPSVSKIKKIMPAIRDAMSGIHYSELEENMLRHSSLAKALTSLQRNSPLSVAFTFEMLKNPMVIANVASAIEIEYRYTFRAQEETDFIEGIRAMVIDKDKKPAWKHNSLKDVKRAEIKKLLAPISSSTI